MQRVFGLKCFPAARRGAVVAVGNFDGVHRGHAWVLELARLQGAPLIVLTFEPHPRAVLTPGLPPFRLTPGAAKLDALERLGVSAAVTMTFDRLLARVSAEAFVAETLVGAMGARHVVVGHDYAFGAGRKGDAALLRAMGREYGFGLTVAPAATDPAGERMSSTLVRDRLKQGRVREAAALLGRRWSISGRLSLEDHKTASISLGEHLRPARGVYRVEVAADGRAPIPALAVWDEGDDADRLMLECPHLRGLVGPEAHVRFLDAVETPREATFSLMEASGAARRQISYN